MSRVGWSNQDEEIGLQRTLRWRKADSNRRSLPVNELVSRAGIRMRARRLGCSRKRLPCSRDHGFESAFLQRGVMCEPVFSKLWRSLQRAFLMVQEAALRAR